MVTVLKIRRHTKVPWLTSVDLGLGGAIPGMASFLCAYVLLGRKVAVVDAGPTKCVPGLIAGLEKLSISPGDVSCILTTHIHMDHGGGLGTALKRLPNAVAIAHPSACRHLLEPEKWWKATRSTLGNLAENYGKPEPVPLERLIAAEDGMELDLGGIGLEMLFTPGHAPHHLSFMEKRDGVLLAGELAGVHARGIRRPATPPPFNLDQQLASINRIIERRPRTLCYGHFAWEADATARLCAHRRKLLLWRDVIAQGLSQAWSRDEIFKEVLRRDREIERLPGLPSQAHKWEMLFVMNSIAGLVGHLEQEAATLER